MKRSEINEIVNGIMMEVSEKFVEEIRASSNEDVITTIAANIPYIAAQTTVQTLIRLGLIQLDPEDAG